MRARHDEHSDIMSDAPIPYFEAVESLLGFGRSTAHRLVKDGRIATFKIGHRVLVRPSEINRLVKAAEKRAVSA